MAESLVKIVTQKIQDNNLPDAPGIYLFYNAKKELIYVGKATSLKNRVRSYFYGKRHTRPIEEMIHEVANIRYEETDSALEAMILEANSIRAFKPIYNMLGRDDKSWNYIVVREGEYPLVETIRQHEYLSHVKELSKRYAHVFGPFPGMNGKETMKLLRKLFHFSTCQKKQGKRTHDIGKPCFYYQIGQCLGVCTQEISAKEYKKKVIQPLVLFLQGKKKRVLTTLKQFMVTAAKQHDFEEAGRLRDQIDALALIHDIAILNKSFFEDGMSGSRVRRIEGYDISNLGKQGIVGSMVVFDTGGPITSAYRRFKIRTLTQQSDVDALDEVLTRRFAHPEWPFPDVVLVDGGAPQVNRAKKVLKRFGLSMPLVGIAKGQARKRNDFLLGSSERAFIHWVNQQQELLIRVRDEAHRFAIGYQRITRKIS